MFFIDLHYVCTLTKRSASAMLESKLQTVEMNQKIWIPFQVAASLWAAAIVGTWCNFLTVIYVGEKFFLFAFGLKKVQ